MSATRAPPWRLTAARMCSWRCRASSGWDEGVLMVGSLSEKNHNRTRPTSGEPPDGRRHRSPAAPPRRPYAAAMTPAEPKSRLAALNDRIQALTRWWSMTRPGRALARYGRAAGGMLAGGITYSAIFSIAAALTLGYTAFMAVLGSDTELRDRVLEAVDSALPGVIDTPTSRGLLNPDDLVLDTGLTPTSVVATAVLLWTAISVMGALKRSIRSMFGIVVLQENAFLTRVRDFLGFLTLAVAVLLTAALTIAAGAAGQWVLDLLGVSGTVAQLGLRALGLLVALAVDAGVFVLLFRVLAGVRPPRRDLLLAALLGAVASGALRLFGTSLVGSAASNPLLATAAALATLLLWVNLLSRVTLLIAAWTANPPAPPAPDHPDVTHFSETPNYVTLSAPHTLTWRYEAITGTVEADAPTRRGATVTNLEHAGDEGRRVLAELRAEEERRRRAERAARERREEDAEEGGLVGRVRWWRRRRGRAG
ncbi:YihY/virulence factor BrkB family protein, partial [Georgenia sp. 311]